MYVGLKFDAFRFELAQPPVDNALFQLEIRDAVAQQPSNAIGFFKDRHRVTGAVELLRRSQTGGPGTDDRDVLAGSLFRQLRSNRAIAEGMLDDAVFNQ